MMGGAQDDRSLTQALKSVGIDLDPVYLREALRVIAQQVMEFDLRRVIEAQPYERAESRLTYRNGYRRRGWKTGLGVIDLEIPKLRSGSYTPGFIGPDLEKAALEIAAAAYVRGAAADDLRRLADDLAVGPLPEPELEAALDDLRSLVLRFQRRPLRTAYPYLWLHVIDHQRAQPSVDRYSAAALGLRADGRYDVLGFQPGSRVDEALWADLLSELLNRGLRGVELVIGGDFDQKIAVRRLLPGAQWQYSREELIRAALSSVHEDARADVAAAISTLFVQTDRRAAAGQLRRVARSLRTDWPEASLLLNAAGDDLFAFLDFPDQDRIMLAESAAMTRIRQAIMHSADAIGVPLNVGINPPGLLENFVQTETANPQLPILMMGVSLSVR
jgi:transposase-like protein